MEMPSNLMNLYYSATTTSDPWFTDRASDVSLEIIKELEGILTDHHVELPDINKLEFLTIEDDDIWGPHFDGGWLSIILKKEYRMSETEVEVLTGFLSFLRGREVAWCYWKNGTSLVLKYKDEYVGNNGYDKDDPKYEQYYVCAVSVVEIFAFDPQDGFILEDLEESRRDPDHKHIEIHYHTCPVKEWFSQPSSAESEDNIDAGE